MFDLDDNEEIVEHLLKNNLINILGSIIKISNNWNILYKSIFIEFQIA